MSLGMFARQAPIGLSVPEWLTVYVADENWTEWHLVYEIVEGAAVMGSLGVTVVLGGRRESELYEDDRSRLMRIGSEIRSFRPWFKLVFCDAAYFSQNEEKLAAGRGIFLRGKNSSHPAGAPEPPPPSFVGDWCVAVDMSTTMVAKTSRPAELIRRVSNEPEVEIPWLQAQWSGPFDVATLTSATVLLALNVAAKPSRFRAETFFFASEYVDETVARAFNSRRMRARWEHREQAPA